ncbi:hypothetical protein [Streptomyces shenzhenensis]|uniref:hypothetical protein n=1 Tax=Streptomyces shenzhenensis TaxID=943815 RepID=UPI0036A0D3EC
MVIPGPSAILTSDGVHDQVPADVFEDLADALVAAAREKETGYRDDATAVVLRIPND